MQTLSTPGKQKQAKNPNQTKTTPENIKKKKKRTKNKNKQTTNHRKDFLSLKASTKEILDRVLKVLLKW